MPIIQFTKSYPPPLPFHILQLLTQIQIPKNKVHDISPSPSLDANDVANTPEPEDMDQELETDVELKSQSIADSVSDLPPLLDSIVVEDYPLEVPDEYNSDESGESDNEDGDSNRVHTGKF